MYASFYRLMQQEPSSFNASTLDKFDFQALCRFSSKLASRDTESLQTMGRSIVQDAFFALLGVDPNYADDMGEIWSRLVSTPEFGSIRAQFGLDLPSRATATLALADAVEQALTTELAEQDAIDAAQGNQDPSGQPIDLDIAAEVIEEAAEDAEAQQAMINAISCGLDGAPPQVYDQALQLAKDLDLASFKDLLGFAKSIVSGAARKTKGGSEELTGYGVSGLSDQVLPHRLVGIARRKREAIMEMVEEALPYRQYDSAKPMGRGPVVMLRDRSGSMDGRNHRVALSLEMAMHIAFEADNRDLVSVAWSDHPGAPYVYGEQGIDRHLRTAPRGGTEPVSAMRAGIRSADEYVDGADIFMLTDAEFDSSEVYAAQLTDEMNRLLEPMRARGMRVWVAVIGTYATPVHKRTLAWADGWVAIPEIGPGEELGRLLAQMASTPDQGGQKLVLAD